MPVTELDTVWHEVPWGRVRILLRAAIEANSTEIEDPEEGHVATDFELEMMGLKHVDATE